MDLIWDFLSKADNQKTLSFIGSVLVAVAGGLWTVIQFFFRRPSAGGPAPSTTITADRGGIAAGGNVTTTHGLSGLQAVLLVAVVAGALLLAAAFVGTRITATNSVVIQGNVENSPITAGGGGEVSP